MMRRTMLGWVAAMLAIGISSEVGAAVLCKKRSGVVTVRDTECKRRETVVNLSDLGSAPPSGPAGGALTGTYPAPTIANGAVGEAQLADGAVTTAKVGAVPAARVRNSAAIASPGGSNTTLTFDSERFDVGGLHDTAANTSRLTAPVAGVYGVATSVSFDSACTGGCFLALRKNGGAFIAADTTTATGVSDEMSVATFVKLNAGDFVEVVVLTNNAVSIQSFDELSPEFSMVWIAPGS